MAITITTTPSNLSSAYNDITFKVASDSDNQIYDDFTISAIDYSGDFCKFTYTTAATTSIHIGNRLLGSGFSDNSYNVVHTVTSVDSATEFTTDIAVTSTDTGSLRRSCSNWKIKADIFYRTGKIYNWTVFNRTGVTTDDMVVSSSQDMTGILHNDYLYINGASKRIDNDITVAYSPGDDSIYTTQTDLPASGYLMKLVQLATFYLNIDSDDINYTLNLKEVLSCVLGSNIETVGVTNVITDGTSLIVGDYAVRFTEVFTQDNGTQGLGDEMCSYDYQVSNTVFQDNTIETAATYTLGIDYTSFDTDVQAYRTAVLSSLNSLTVTEIATLNTFVLALKAGNVWDDIEIFYPLLGSNRFAFKWNIKDLRDDDAAFRLTFANTPTPGSLGVVFNGSSQFADTKLTPADYKDNRGYLIGVKSYSGTGNVYGAQTAALEGDTLLLDNGSGRILYRLSSTAGTTAPNETDNLIGVYRSSATTLKLYRNGIYVSDDAVTSTVQPDRSLYLGATNRSTGVTSYGAFTMGMFISIKNTSAAKFQIMNAAAKTYLQSLGRLA